MMHMRPNTLLRYMHHAHAVEAGEALGQSVIAALPHLKPVDQGDTLERWRLLAEGLDPRKLDEAMGARRQARWDANWNTLRGKVGTAPRSSNRPAPPVPLRPGERIVAPE